MCGVCACVCVLCVCVGLLCVFCVYVFGCCVRERRDLQVKKILQKSNIPIMWEVVV